MKFFEPTHADSYNWSAGWWKRVLFLGFVVNGWQFVPAVGLWLKTEGRFRLSTDYSPWCDSIFQFVSWISAQGFGFEGDWSLVWAFLPHADRAQAASGQYFYQLHFGWGKLSITICTAFISISDTPFIWAATPPLLLIIATPFFHSSEPFIWTACLSAGSIYGWPILILVSMTKFSLSTAIRCSIIEPISTP